mmetsp:Transcript_57306/g.170881  ORF Transcript_57306/g.170881 Transcript_57306/m.170881 type:complete len:1034 (-) Transcript_57306:405-3506(-)
MSDRQFFPCKCGYQVCMWCWHRIRESESGLCPACRTPYGDDPHEFSAVDMEEVVKANKEKAAAEKRERERLRQQQAAAATSASSGGLSFGSGGVGTSSGALSNLGNMHIGGGSDGDHAVAMGSGSIGRGQLEPPKDRNQLANMRVIRRNLVYAVGLPPTIATEDQLRKPDFFGEYGKISKIVINRNHNGNGDPRRASASAYVTFAHKEDTLSCILALDGFYLDGRNVRASYGTSKYCSAFIKNVRCNNPDCTYLHCMGDAEDTFTKQEIQAGYVTSGRDVLARQQQQIAASSCGCSRRRVGGGGPSGTGKVPSNPVFPPPTYDEPPKPPGSGGLVVNISSATSAHAAGSRSMSVASTGFSTVAAGGQTAASVAAGKIARSISLGSSQPTAGISSISSTPAVVTGLPPASAGKNSSKVPKSFGAAAQALGPAPATAASVVAGLASASSTNNAVQPPAHTTLTPLGSLKRGSSMPISVKASSVSVLGGNKSTVVSLSSGTNSLAGSDGGPDGKGFTPAEHAAFLEQKKEAAALASRQHREMSKLSSLRSGGGTVSSAGREQQSGTSSSSSTPSLASVGGPPVPAMKHAAPGKETVSSSGVIGGTVIGSISSKTGAGAVGSVVGQGISGLTSLGAVGSDSSAKSGIIIGGAKAPSLNFGSIGNASSNGGSSLLGGQPLGGGVRSIGGAVKDGQCSNIGGSVLAPQSSTGQNLAGGTSDKWGNVPDRQDNGLFGNNSSFGIGGTGIWGSDGPGRPSGAGVPPLGNPGTVGSVIQPGNPIGGNIRGGEIVGGRVVSQTVSAVVGGAVGGSSLFGNNAFAGSSGHNAGSSALASMLGIELPSGSGSLREAPSPSPSLWGSSPNQPPVGSLSNPGAPPNPIGPGAKPGGGLVIGHRPGHPSSAGVPIGGFGSNSSGAATTVGSNNNDIALLQSLLPGVRITSGNAHQPAAPISSGNSNVIGGARLGPVSGLAPAPPQHHQQRGAVGVGIGGMNIHPQQHQGSRDTWGGSGLYAGSAAPNPVSSQQQQHQQQQQHRPASIW